jgi:hypothetical protein
MACLPPQTLALSFHCMPAFFAVRPSQRLRRGLDCNSGHSQGSSQMIIETRTLLSILLCLDDLNSPMHL